MGFRRFDSSRFKYMSLKNSDDPYFSGLSTDFSRIEAKLVLLHVLVCLSRPEIESTTSHIKRLLGFLKLCANT